MRRFALVPGGGGSGENGPFRSSSEPGLFAARARAQGKRVLVEGIGTAGITRHETGQPKESENTEHSPFSGTDVTTRTFTGSYGWTFTGTALNGLWGVRC